MEGIIDACTTCPCVHMGYAYTRAAALHLGGNGALTCRTRWRLPGPVRKSSTGLDKRQPGRLPNRR